MDEKVAKTPRPHMLDADEVAELLRIKKGSAYEVIRKMNAEQEARGRVVIRGRVRSDVFDALLLPGGGLTCPCYKDGNNGTFYVQCYYRDARGSKRHKTKQRLLQSEVEAASCGRGQFKSPERRGHGHDVRPSSCEVYACGGEAAHTRAHLAHQGVHHQRASSCRSSGTCACAT